MYKILTIHRNTFKLHDKNNTFRALVVSHMKQTIPQFWDSFMTRIMALYGKNFVAENSDRPGYDFMAIHYHWYNRYAESVSLFVLSLYY